MEEKIIIYDLFNKESFAGSDDDGKPYFTLFQNEVKKFDNIIQAKERMISENREYTIYFQNRIITFITVYYFV